MIRTRLTVLALILSASLAHAGIDNAGTTAGNFLSVGTGAGILSMGGATLGGGRDLNAAAWNPAVLGYLSSSQYAFSHASLALDVSQDWVAASGRIGRSATRWSASALYQNDGTMDGRDAFGTPTGSFNVSNLALGLAVARPFSPDITAGARLHMVNESLGSASGSGFGADLGVQARRGAFGFGAAARNLGGKMKYDSGSFDLPGVFGVGASWSDESQGLRLALDANFPHAYYNDVRLGGEWMWQQRVALRAGYRLELGAESAEPLGGPSFGLGTGVNGLWFDYAFLAGVNQAQGAHRFGLTFHPSFFQQRGAAPRADVAPADAPAAMAPMAVAPVAPKQIEPKPAAPKPAAPEPVAQPAPAAVAPVAVAPPAPKPVAPAPVVQLAPAAAPVEVAAAVAATAPAAELPAPAPVPAKAVKVASPRPAPVVAAASAPAKAVVPASAGAVTAQAPTPAPVAVVTPPAPAAAPAPAPARAAVVTPPAPAAAPAPVADAPVASTVRPIAAVAASPAPTVMVVKAAAPAARPSVVEVQKNETMAEIAKRWGVSVPAIMMENNLVTSQVKQGQKLRLPKR